jgi:hypothetical protein
LTPFLISKGPALLNNFKREKGPAPEGATFTFKAYKPTKANSNEVIKKPEQ